MTTHSTNPRPRIEPPHPPTVIGFIRRAASGLDRRHDEDEIHRLATELGYVVAAIVYDVSRRGAVINQLRAIAWGEDADAVITPSADHLSEIDVNDLIAYADTIYVKAAQRFTRRGGQIIAD